jgi:hypothetical protein
MSSHHHASTHGKCLRGLALAVVLLFVTPGVQARTAPLPVVKPACTALASPLLADGWSVKKSMGKFASSLNQTRVIQLAMLAMCIAIWIIWWRK